MSKIPKKIEKSLGDGTFVWVDNPDYYALDGRAVKHRKPTNLTPKKKKRK